jgi:O-acetylhomoserine (thiol)-lyase
VLERRVAELEGGLESLCVSTGQAALNYAVLNLAEMGSNIVSIPQIYGTTHTLFAHILPSQGIGVRFAKTDRADAIEKLIDEKTLAVFRESIGNPAGNICDIEAVAAVARRHGIPLIVDNTVATPILLRPIEYGADIVVNSLTKFEVTARRSAARSSIPGASRGKPMRAGSRCSTSLTRLITV